MNCFIQFNISIVYIYIYIDIYIDRHIDRFITMTQKYLWAKAAKQAGFSTCYDRCFSFIIDISYLSTIIAYKKYIF